MKVGYIGGFWSANIGNSFYNIGMLRLLGDIFGESNIYFIPDPPQVNWPNLKNDYNPIHNLDINLYIISGPILGYGIEKIYSKIFDQITKRGGKIGFISAGSCDYSEREAIFVSNFLNKYGVSFLFTRDIKTYELFKNKLKAPIYNGICTSMFMNDAIDPPKINDNYVLTNFSYLHEPLIEKKMIIGILKEDSLSIHQNKF